MSHPPAALPLPLRLLFLLARLELSEAQRQEVLSLCQRITDWGEVTRLARNTYVLPLVYQHLSQLAPGSISADDMARMHHASLTIVAYNLKTLAEQKRLIQDVLTPLAIPYLCFKGPSLACRYYPDPGLRYCGDIDVLVPRERLAELLETALRLGYRPSEPEALSAQREALEFAARKLPVINLITPGEVEIEFHSQLDRKADIYDTDELIGEREALVVVGETTLWVMPTEELFVYLCLHHTRHCWSNLHWLVDLDAIQRHPDFNLEAIRACAQARGLSTTLEASLELYRRLGVPGTEGDDYPLSPHGKALHEACLATLLGGNEVETEYRRKRPAPDFAFSWQTTPTYQMSCRLWKLKKRFIPSYTDYAACPLPPRWQWLYYLTRPCRRLYKRVVARSLAQ
jgi:hypothetical protein